MAALVNKALVADLPQNLPAVLQLRDDDVRASGDGIILDRRLFARRLLLDLQRHSDSRVTYVGQNVRPESGNRSRDSGHGNARDSMAADDDHGFGRDSDRGIDQREADDSSAFGDDASATYRMEIEVGRSTDSAHPAAQRFRVVVRERMSTKPVWQGIYLLDVPAPAVAGEARH
ncbi:hypothetical protein A6456_37415 [Paraburkholderia tropica]|nr:hypothetical protein A6456_37415 [Paraburkholderia tropica]